MFQGVPEVIGDIVCYIPAFLLGILARLEGKMVLWSAQILEYVEVRTKSLNWRKEKSHGRLGATLMLLRKMCRRQ